MTTSEMIKDFTRKLARRAHDEGWAADSVKVTVVAGEWKAEVEATCFNLDPDVLFAP